MRIQRALGRRKISTRFVRHVAETEKKTPHTVHALIVSGFRWYVVRISLHSDRLKYLTLYIML